jgi:hypothetical protein
VAQLFSIVEWIGIDLTMIPREHSGSKDIHGRHIVIAINIFSYARRLSASPLQSLQDQWSLSWPPSTLFISRPDVLLLALALASLPIIQLTLARRDFF